MFLPYMCMAAILFKDAEAFKQIINILSTEGPYMGMAAILFNGTKPFEQFVIALSTEGPRRNLVKTA